MLKVKTITADAVVVILRKKGSMQNDINKHIEKKTYRQDVIQGHIYTTGI